MGVRARSLTRVDAIINELDKLALPLRPSTACAPYSTGVIAALPVNHRVGLSLESLILQIRSRVNDVPFTG